MRGMAGGLLGIIKVIDRHFLGENEQHRTPVECCGHVSRADLSIQGLLLGYKGLWAPGARRWQLVQHKVILNKCVLNSRVN